MSCSECEKYREILEQIQDRLAGVLWSAPAPKAHDYQTVHGKLIAAAAAAQGRSLSDVSVQAGFAQDHLARICRGAVLRVYTAKLYGAELGIDLMPFAKGSKSKGWNRKDAAATEPPAAPELPLGGEHDQAVA